MTEQEEKRVRDFGLFFYLWSLLSLAAFSASNGLAVSMVITPKFNIVWEFYVVFKCYAFYKLKPEYLII